MGDYLGEGCFFLRERNPSRHRYPFFSLIDGTGRNRTWQWDRYSQINHVSGGRATVRRDDRMGAIDRNGKEVVPCRYAYVGSFHRNRAVVTIASSDRMLPEPTQTKRTMKTELRFPAVEVVCLGTNSHITKPRCAF